MYKPKSVWQNEFFKIFRDFEIETIHLIMDRRQDLKLIKKKKELTI